jgi:hypothetical protein
MTNLVRYLTHPQVNIDPAIPVPSWSLSEAGRARTNAAASTGRLSGTTQVIFSGERKAIEAAEIIAAKLNVDVEVREAMHKNDRSATGFLLPDEFKAVANQFFAQPNISIRGLGLGFYNTRGKSKTVFRIGCGTHLGMSASGAKLPLTGISAPAVPAQRYANRR